MMASGTLTYCEYQDGALFILEKRKKEMQKYKRDKIHTFE